MPDRQQPRTTTRASRTTHTTLTTHITSGAMSGEQMFQMKAQLTVPQALDVDTLQAALEGLANELMVDVSFDAAGGTRG